MEINQRVYYNENQLKKIPIPFEGIEGSWVNYEQKKDYRNSAYFYYQCAKCDSTWMSARKWWS